ncbi:MAG: hypothetical protein M3384_13335 [Acidobacteriota bacterium]|nr:hypothetical protein [Acidobacteriota bacterium]
MRHRNANYFLISTFSEFAYDSEERSSKKFIRGQKGKDMIHSIISKVLFCFSAVVVGIGLIFLILAVKRGTLPYNSEGNYFDGAVNYHEQSIMAYDIFAAACFLGAIMFSLSACFFSARNRLLLASPVTYLLN